MLPTLKNRQLALVAAAAEKLPAEKRRTFVDRVIGRLQLYGFRCSDDDLGKIIHQALVGLIQGTAA
jgi:hypothetical protein